MDDGVAASAPCRAAAGAREPGRRRSRRASRAHRDDYRVLALDEQMVWILINTSHAVSSNMLYALVQRMRNGNELIFESRCRLQQYRFHATVDALTGLFNRH